jgi:putative proteasome-type protease
MIRSTWGQRLREVFEGIDDPRWDGGDAPHPLMAPARASSRCARSRHPGERIV